MLRSAALLDGMGGGVVKALAAEEHAASYRAAPSRDAVGVASVLRGPSLGDRAAKTIGTQGEGRPGSGRRPADPDLLQKLLHFVRQELRHLDAQSAGYVDERLDVFRRVFGHFTAAYGAYAPLLLAVQEAYESALQDARGRATGVDAISERLALMQDEARRMVARVRQEAADNHAILAGQLDERDSTIRAASKENEKLKSEIKSLRTLATHQQRLKDDMELKNVELAKQVELWQAEASEARRAAGGEDNEIANLRMELKTRTGREEMLLAVSE